VVEFVTWVDLLLEKFPLVPGIFVIGDICINIFQHSWYHGDIDPDRVEAILKGRGQHGCFLVTSSYSSPGDYSLCVR